MPKWNEAFELTRFHSIPIGLDHPTVGRITKPFDSNTINSKAKKDSRHNNLKCLSHRKLGLDTWDYCGVCCCCSFVNTFRPVRIILISFFLSFFHVVVAHLSLFNSTRLGCLSSDILVHLYLVRVYWNTLLIGNLWPSSQNGDQRNRE